MSPLVAAVLLLVLAVVAPLIVSDVSAWSHSPTRRRRLAVRAHQKATARRRTARSTR
jgi:hypothetical protein